MNFLLILTLLLLYFFTLPLLDSDSLLAKKKGIVGRTNTTSISCGECHKSNPNPNLEISVTPESGSFIVEPLTKIKFILTVSSSSGSIVGCNIAVKNQLNGSIDVGLLEPEPNSGLYSSKGELTHSQPKPLVNNTATFEFYWTAPEQPGEYYIHAVALVGNNNGKEDAGDVWNFLTPRTIVVNSSYSSSEEESKKPCIIFPNPYSSNSQVLISDWSAVKQIKEFKIFSLTDFKFSISTTSDFLTKHLQNLPAGLYFVFYSFGGKDYLQKLIKVD